MVQLQRGKFISIEGSEGAGKSTALQFIKEYLQQHYPALDCLFTHEPGGTILAEEMRRVLLYSNSQEKMTPTAELLLMFASRAQHMTYCIHPALEQGRWVISDRFVDASYAYQGDGRGIDAAYITWLDHWVVGSLYPDLTLLLDISPEIGMKRAYSRSKLKDRIEQEEIEFFKRVRNGYLKLAQQNSKRIKVIDASQSLSVVHTQIQHYLDGFLKR